VKLRVGSTFARVDPEQFAVLSGFKWYVNNNYARNRKLGYMHRFIAQAQPHEEVDHINGDPLDNRKTNLRCCRRIENSRNTSSHRDGASKYKGVYWHRQRSRWHAQIKIGERRVSLGLHSNEEDAARRYDEVAAQHFGVFARLNFPRVV
jgi:hypothetical protein